MSKLEKCVFEWEHFLTYLCGPIDFDPEGGKEWRLHWTKELVNLGFKSSQVLSPTKKPLSNTKFHLDNEADIIQKHRSDKNWNALSSTMSEIAHIDLRLVDKSDIVLAKFPLDKKGNRVFTVGSIHEIVVARQQKKPVMVVWEGGKETCSAWLMWLVGHQNVFSSFEELLERLKKMSNGEAAINVKDWLLLDFNKNLKEI